MGPRLAAVNNLRNRYCGIDLHNRKIDYRRYERQILPGLPALRLYVPYLRNELPLAAIKLFRRDRL
jgi:hypothetical protein